MQSFTPVVPTQSIYRTLLQAMAHPCRPYTLDSSAFDSPLLALAETLLDHEVGFCLHPNAPDEWEGVLFASTKASPVAWEQADFLFIQGSDSEGLAATAQRGDPTFPDRGATLIYVIDSPDPSTGPTLDGPGLRVPGPPDCNPFPPAEWAALKEINDDFPLGVDALVLIGTDTVCALPRSTRITL